MRSSPALRCRQTVAPLASALSREVSVADALAEGGDGSAVLELVEAHDAGDLVLCSHGDVIPEVLRALQRRGVELPPDLRWAKASIWSIERSGSTFVRALYTAAPG